MQIVVSWWSWSQNAKWDTKPQMDFPFKSGKNRFCYVLFGHSNSSWFGFSVAELNVGQGRFPTTSQPNQRLAVRWFNLFLLAVSLRSRTTLEGLEGFVQRTFHWPQWWQTSKSELCFFTLPWKGAEWNPRMVKVLQFNEDRSQQFSIFTTLFTRHEVGSSRFWHLHCKIEYFSTTRWHEQD